MAASSGPLEQIVLGEDAGLDLGHARARSLARLDREQLALIVPFVERRADVEPLVALHADELGAVHGGERLRDLGLADPGLALDQERALEGVHHPERGREVAVGDIADPGQPGRDRLARDGDARHVDRPLHHASRGPPPPLRGEERAPRPPPWSAAQWGRGTARRAVEGASHFNPDGTPRDCAGSSLTLLTRAAPDPPPPARCDRRRAASQCGSSPRT